MGMAVSQIIHQIYVGDLDDAVRWDGNKLCVLEKYPKGYKADKNSVLIPILRESDGGEDVTILEGNLEYVAHIIQTHVDFNEKLLLHCSAGMERSPLAMTWYIHDRMGLPLEDAFDFVKAKRPQALNRLQWLNSREPKSK